ncbi:MAG: hydrogen gas-evolving membrane-bound hydrogenase subunit E [Oscillospiraceae bacterium]
MSKNWEKFATWVNGDREEKVGELFSMARPPQREHKSFSVDETEKKKQLRGFLGWYPFAFSLIGLVMVVVLLATVLSMPTFGDAANPTNNEVPARYLEKGYAETGAPNAVAGMILNYRGFDTFGESCVLFLAVSCVFMLLAQDKNNTTPQERHALHREEKREREDVILRQVTILLVPFILLFGIYMLLGGHLSPGGGFSGGAILGGGLILYSSACGTEKIHRFFNRKIFDIVRVSGLMLYAVLFGYYIFTGANGLPNHVPLSIGGLILPIDIAVGLVVACTMYGFYAMFTKGEV